MMSDYKELLERACVLGGGKVWVEYEEARNIVNELVGSLRAVIAERDELRGLHNYINLNSSLIMFRRAQSADFEKARAEAAEARLAEYERWRSEVDTAADKLAKEVGAREPFATQVAVIALTSFAAQAAARQREEDAKIAENQSTERFGGLKDALHNTTCNIIATAIRKGATP
jgi:hypothetical protein